MLRSGSCDVDAFFTSLVHVWSLGRYRLGKAVPAAFGGGIRRLLRSIQAGSLRLALRPAPEAGRTLLKRGAGLKFRALGLDSI